MGSLGATAWKRALLPTSSSVPRLSESVRSASSTVGGAALEESKKVRVNAFKAAIAPSATQRRQIGLWTGLRSTLVAEMISHTSGLDWFVIDMEHGPNEVPDVLLQMQASQYGHAEPVVRVPWNEIVTVKRVLDLGCQSIIFPWVNTAEEARKAVEATRYPGLGEAGVRGVMSLARMTTLVPPTHTTTERPLLKYATLCRSRPWRP